MPERFTPIATRAWNWKVLSAVAIFAGVVAASLLVQHDLARRAQTARDDLNELQPVHAATLQLRREIAQISALGNNDETRPENVAEAQQRLAEALAALRAFFGRSPPATGHLDTIEQQAAMLSAAGPDAFRRDVFRAAMKAADGLDKRVAVAARDRAAADTLATERADRGESRVLVLLLAAVSVSAFSLWRLETRVRREIAQKSQFLAELRESETKYRSIFDHSTEGIFQTTPEGRFITANETLARMYGYKSPQHLVESLSDIANQLYVVPEQRASLLDALQQGDVVSNFEFEVVRADGRVIWLRENVRAVRDEAGTLLYLQGAVQDVSDRWWSERRRQLQYATARVLGDAASVAEAQPKILQVICEILEWDLGAVWAVEREELRCIEIWHAPDVDVAEFERANIATTYRLGKGLVGEVWKTGEPKWIANLANQVGSPNAAIALKAGMNSAFCVPILERGAVYYVLEFFSPKISLPDPELLQTLSAIGNQLGQLIERKSAEEQLRQSEMRKAAILHSALDCIMSFDESGAISEFNPAAEEAFGYRREEVLGRSIVELIIPESERDEQQTVLGLFPSDNRTQRVVGTRLELTVMRRDRSEFPAEIAISRMAIHGKPLYTAYLRDLTRRRAAERVTSELAAVVANSNDAIVACTPDGVIRSWNLGAEQIFGYPAAEAVGQPLQLLMPTDRHEEFTQMLTVLKRGESRANYETIRVRKDGRRISVSLTDSPIRGERGAITGLSSIARDMTERKRLEQDLLQSQKMDAVGRLAGGIAHDFNNILTAILGYSDLLLGQIEERHWMYKHLSEIRKAADFAAALTHQLLAFSRRQPLDLRVFNVNSSILNLQKMLQRVIGEHIKVRTELTSENGRVKADASQLEQVLLNLCVNARDAMPNGGAITISTADYTYFLEDFFEAEMPPGEYVKLTVADSGVGIPPEIIKNIFEPFFTTKELGHGTGLGLATCYGIIKQCGGYITVDSTVGEGTAFSIFLPRVDALGEKAPARNDLGDLPGGRETILYVEDEVAVRRLTTHVLRRLGYTVLEAADAGEARAVVENGTRKGIDLLFSDVVLPDLGGRELSHWVAERNRSTKVLFTSGYVDENLLTRHGLQSETAFLQKPFTPTELAKKVREVIDAPLPLALGNGVS